MIEELTAITSIASEQTSNQSTAESCSFKSDLIAIKRITPTAQSKRIPPVKRSIQKTQRKLPLVKQQSKIVLRRKLALTPPVVLMTPS